MNVSVPNPGAAHAQTLAVWYKGDQARAVPVRLRGESIAAIRVETVEVGEGESFLAAWDLEEGHPDGFFRVRISGAGAGDRVGVLEGRDATFEAWLRENSGQGRRKGAWNRLLAWTMSLAVLVVVLYFVALPLATEAALRRMPRTWDVKVGETVLPLLSQGVVVPEGDVAAAIGRGQAFLDSLAAGTGITFKLHWVPDGGTVNAFALPSGDIVLYQGIVRKMESPDELLGVLAHEAGHVVERHGMNAVVRSSVLGLIAGAALGDASGGLSVLLGHATALEQLSYGRKSEASADAFALKALAARRQPCGGLARLFARGLSGDLPGWTVYASTHPTDEKRAKALAALRAETPGCADSGVSALSRKDLKALQR